MHDRAIGITGFRR
ncbi:hypothetical protein VCHC21A1_1966, partial [Vibrio cholerae HC-21A1]